MRKLNYWLILALLGVGDYGDMANWWITKARWVSNYKKTGID